jgi:hypothetical protein
MDWQRLLVRQEARYADGEARLASEPFDPLQLVRLGNVAYAAGLALLMLGRTDESRSWLDRSAARWRESWEHATPTSWGRPIGAIKASLLAGRDEAAANHARWALELGTEQAESPIGRYAAALALLTLGRDGDAVPVAASLAGLDDFPADVAASLAAIAGGDGGAYAAAVAAVVRSFETREAFLEDAAVADTALVLQVLAARRGLGVELGPSPVLPPG